MAASHAAFLSLLDQGRVATGQVLSDWVATDSDDMDEVDAYLDANVDLLEDASDYDLDALRADVSADRDILVAFANDAETVTADRDPKLAAIIECLAQIAAEARATAVGDEAVRGSAKGPDIQLLRRHRRLDLRAPVFDCRQRPAPRRLPRPDHVDLWNQW